MTKNILVVFLTLFFFQKSFCQVKSFTVPRSATVHVSDMREDWNPVLMERDNDDEVADEYSANNQLNIVKQRLLSRLHPTEKKTSISRNIIDTPFVWKGILGNNPNGVPNDNDLAVSTTGYVVSVLNTSLFKYDLNKDSSLGITSLQTLSTPLGNSHSKYDPKVIYDPDENKFVVVFLAGFSSDATDIIIAFSQTDDPNGTWNLYSLPGNPLNDSLWTDFPAIALTNHELFITVNHLVDNETWQAGWRRSVIWQVNKLDGFHGDSLHTQLHYDVNFGGNGVRNLCPVKGGSHLYGSDIYFLSERNLDEVNDTFFLVHLTDTIDAPSQTLTVEALVSDVPYFIPISARQPFINDLATNDSRVLGAFYENDRIQFVGNTTDTNTATSAFYHGVITNVSSAPAITLHILSDDTICYGYPNLAYAGSGIADNTAIINVLRSGVNLFPGYSAFVTDGDGSYSVMKDVKDGVTYHSAIVGLQRWGDYTGAQRDYVSPGAVWVNGSFTLINHHTSTWISQLSLLPPPSGVHQVNTDKPQINLYPNPVSQNITIEFEVSLYTRCTFEIYNAQGKMVKLLMNERVSPGKNQFSFSAQPLAAGEYFLKISSEGKEIAVQKFVKGVSF